MTTTTTSLRDGDEPRVEATATDPEERVRELEHLLELERARRQAMEQGLERLSHRVNELARENAELRRRES